MAREPAIWFVMVNGQKTGPISRAEVALEFASENITGDSYVWKTGMSGWTPGAEVPELAAIFAAEAEQAVLEPPPPPPTDARPRAAAAKPATAAQPGKPFRRTAFSTSPEDKKKAEKGKGMMEFNTSHFNLNDLPAADEGEKKKGMEFDTSHFRLADLPPKGEEKDWSKLTVQRDVRTFKEGVVGYADTGQIGSAAKGAPAPAPPKKGESGDWSKLTVQHDVRTFKEGVTGYADAMAAVPEAAKAQPPKRATGQRAAPEGWRPTAHAGSPRAKTPSHPAPTRGPAQPTPAPRVAQPAPAPRAAQLTPTPRAAQPASRPRPTAATQSTGSSTKLYAALGAGTVVALIALWVMFG